MMAPSAKEQRPSLLKDVTQGIRCEAPELAPQPVTPKDVQPAAAQVPSTATRHGPEPRMPASHAPVMAEGAKSQVPMIVQNLVAKGTLLEPIAHTAVRGAETMSTNALWLLHQAYFAP